MSVNAYMLILIESHNSFKWNSTFRFFYLFTSLWTVVMAHSIMFQCERSRQKNQTHKFPRNSNEYFTAFSTHIFLINFIWLQHHALAYRNSCCCATVFFFTPKFLFYPMSVGYVIYTFEMVEIAIKCVMPNFFRMIQNRFASDQFKSIPFDSCKVPRNELRRCHRMCL